MVKRTAANLALGLVLGLPWCATAVAQINVRGQFLLPDGNLPAEPIRFYLSRDDGQVNEYRYTDSNGRFILERLSGQLGHTLTVNSDGSMYGDTIYSFMPSYQQVIRVTLNPPPRKKTLVGSTASVASSYKPAPQVAALHDRAMKEVKRNRIDVAERLLRQAIEQDSKFIAPFNDLGVLLMQGKKYSEAEKVLRQALEVDPKSIHALLNLGITLNHLREYTEAIPPLREALRLEPRLVAAHLHLGIALVETDQFEEAERELTRAIKAHSTDEILIQQLYLGKLYAQTGQAEKALAAWKSYLEKDPDSPNAARVRSLMEQLRGQTGKPQ